jgi:hypothetical protein
LSTVLEAIVEAIAEAATKPTKAAALKWIESVILICVLNLACCIGLIDRNCCCDKVV